MVNFSNLVLKELAEDKLADEVFIIPSTWEYLLDSRMPLNDFLQLPEHLLQNEVSLWNGIEICNFNCQMKNIYLQTFLRLFAELPQTPGLISRLDVAAPSVDGSNSTMPFIFPFPTKTFKLKTKTKFEYIR